MKLPKAKTQSSAKAANPAPVKTNNVERAKRHLIERYGFKEDELAVTFKTDDDLLKYYNNVASGLASAASKTEDDEIGWDSVDTHDVSDEVKARMRTDKSAAALGAQLELQESLPPSAQVKPEEIQETQKGLAELLKELEDEDPETKAKS